MDKLIFVELMKADVVPRAGFADHTSLLSGQHRFPTHVGLAFCAPDVTKDPSVSGVFNGVQPSPDGWVLEVAVELPDLLPTFDGLSETVLTAADGAGRPRTVCLSNRLSRFHFQAGRTAYHALVPRARPWHGAATIKSESGEHPAIEEQLRTVAAMRFPIQGATAEGAFESSIRPAVEAFFECANSVLRAVRACRKSYMPLARNVQWGAVPYAYVLVSGAGPSQGARLMLNGGRASLNPPDLSGDLADSCRDIASGKTQLEDVDRLLGEAESSVRDGEHEFAFLQAVIAAEIATTRLIRSECLRRGVSKAKLDNVRKEMTYSWALNVGLSLCLPAQRRPSPELVAAMNAARNVRNDLMHEAAFRLSGEEVAGLIARTTEYVAALRVTGRD